MTAECTCRVVFEGMAHEPECPARPTDWVTDDLVERQVRKDEAYAASPIETPRARDGTVLALGQRVVLDCEDGHAVRQKSDQPYPVVTKLTIRCYGDSSDEPVREYRDGEFVEVGRRPTQQVWVFVDGVNCVHSPDQVVEVVS